MKQIMIHPYLVFQGNCAEAMSFYKDCLDAQLNLQTIGESPMAKEWPAHLQQNILHGTLLKNDTILLMASDMGEPQNEKAKSHVNISLTCTSKEEVTAMYSKLSSGGVATRPLHDFYMGTIGALTDKYGIDWILYYGNN